MEALDSGDWTVGLGSGSWSTNHGVDEDDADERALSWVEQCRKSGRERESMSEMMK